jgi:NhaP-type Na+/H+ or K+/H+ antiporter
LANFIGLMLLGLAVFGPIGWLTLRWIGARYERQKLSDQSITLDAIWLVFGIVESIVLFSGGAVFLFSGLLAFAVYKPISSAGLRLLERDASSTQESA